MEIHHIRKTKELVQGFSHIDRAEQNVPEAIEAIKKHKEFKVLIDTASPAFALLDPEFREIVRTVDFVWAIDTYKNNDSQLIAGDELLSYSIQMGELKRGFSSAAIKYSSNTDTLQLLVENVNAIRKDYHMQTRIIKVFGDTTYPPMSLPFSALSNPIVREKVKEADAFSLVNKKDRFDAHVVANKKARSARHAKGNPPHIKFMVFFFEKGVDSIKAFAEEIAKIKGKDWQN
jgi:hypothetical protein